MKQLWGPRDVSLVGLQDATDRILMVRTSKLPDWWQPVGGGMEAGDDSPEATVLREVREELGLEISAADLELVISTEYDFGEGVVHFYRSQIGLAKGRIIINRSEIVEYQWFTVAEARALPVLPATSRFLAALSEC